MVVRKKMKEEKILLSHGAGGRQMHQLIKDLILKNFNNPILNSLQDSAIIKFGKLRLAYTADSYIVNPVFFPGGDIGVLAVNGTINDLAMVGAIPLHLSLSLIVEEGFPLQSLSKIVNSIKRESKKSGVSIVCGDLKVGETKSLDKIFINTSGIGIIPKGVDVSTKRAKPGDCIIVSGEIAEHGIAVLNRRNNLNLRGNLKTDSRPLHFLVRKMLKASRKIHCLRDPTRGGLATTLNEIAVSSKAGMEIEENKIPIKKGISSACEMLGLDPLYVANEGKLIVVIKKEDAQKVLKAMRSTKWARNAAVIGRVIRNSQSRVVLKTKIGGRRILEMLSGEQLPRIC